MKLNFSFSNLLGTVYRQGNVDFLPDGFTLASPVGNKVTFFDLKNHKSETLPVEARLNMQHVALTPNGTHVMLVTESGEGLYVSLASRTVLYRHAFGKALRALRFSPSGGRLAAARDTDVHVYRTPSVVALQFNPFYMEHIYHVASDTVTCLSWSEDGRLLLIGSSDTQTRVVGGDQQYKNLYVCGMSGHSGPIIDCFFLSHSYDVVSVDKHGFVFLWKASIDYDGLVSSTAEMKPEDVDKLSYKKLHKHRVHDSVPGGTYWVTCASYNADKRLMAIGYSHGVFTLHELPDFQLVQSFTLAAGEGQSGSAPVRSVVLNRTGDWLAVAASAGGARTQLIVWEWQSESFVMKQHGHSHTLTCVSHSPDGCRLATGSENGHVKVWHGRTGFCEVTFAEHAACVTAVCWTQAGKAVLSAAVDGTVRACDLKRYRNFRTLATPRPSQLCCVAADASGELVAAGSRDLFDVFLWSLNNGRLLEVFSGHESPVSAVDFAPMSSGGGTVASCSWDGFVRLWHVGQGGATTDALSLPADGLDMAFSPDGRRLAALTMDSQITIFDWRESLQVGSIECKLDLDPGRAEGDVVKAKTTGAAKSFTSLAYSPDGDYIVAGGQSAHICIYHARHFVLVRKFTVTQNYSLAGVSAEMDRRRVSEFGATAASIAGGGGDSDTETITVDERGKAKRRLTLPGATVGDMSERTARPEIVVNDVQFCPTGLSFAAVTSEGLLIYGAEKQLLFDPYDLSAGVTPASVRAAIDRKDYGQALADSVRLNDAALVRRALHSAPAEQIAVLAASMHVRFAVRLLRRLAADFATSPHVEYDALWLRQLLRAHGAQMKTLAQGELRPHLAAMHEAVAHRRAQLANLCESNQFTLDYLLATCAAKRSQHVADAKMETDDNAA